MVQLNIDNGATPGAGPQGNLGLTECGTCATHVSSCVTGILGQAVLTAMEITRRAIANGELHLDPHNPDDIQYVFDAVVATIEEDLKKPTPILGVEMPTDAAEIAKIREGIPDAIRQGQAVYAAVGILASRLPVAPARAMNPTHRPDIDAVFGKVVQLVGAQLPRIASDATELGAYRKQIPAAIIAAIKAMPQPA
ncbi:MAG: hypothetical protein SFW65_07700 [Alphaproteobacteria bacterium]|nr:hypothetical protein [Alphaproteobacteria bacterium]